MPFSPAPSGCLSVSQLNACSRLLLEDVFGQVCVVGEISNLSRPSSGHLYFSLKDAHAQIRCALFKPKALNYGNLRNGMSVSAQGRLSLFEARGEYQLILEAVETAGQGALTVAFEQLKTRLDNAGLFAPERKKNLPRYPERIGVITSPTGAALQDILSVFQRRAPQVSVELVPTPVQGQEATTQIVQAIQYADQQHFDALILARGGGSLEDLWCFNEERVAYAIAACQTPLVSAIGHETDTTITDLIADCRAPTPSAAAEILAPDCTVLQEQLKQLEHRLTQALRKQLIDRQHQLHQLDQRLYQSGRVQTQPLSVRLDHTTQRLMHAFETVLTQRQQALQSLAGALNQLSPLATLKRGYSLVCNDQGAPVQNTSALTAGTVVRLHMYDGSVRARVLPTEKPPAPTER